MIIRGEFMFVALPYFIYLFLRKDWKAIIALGVFPFIINLLGFIETKDIFISSTIIENTPYGPRLTMLKLDLTIIS